MKIRLKLTPYFLNYKCLPKEFDGFKIALISDLHDAKFPYKRNELITKKISEHEPDVIMLAGDMHQPKNDDKRYISFLKDLIEIAPIFFAEGNHDCISRKQMIPEYRKYDSILKQLGVFNLHGNGARLFAKNGNDYINISGIGWNEKDEVLPYYEESAFNIFLVHDPEIFDNLPKKPQLMLSGHIHAGLIKMPNGQGIFSPVTNLKKGIFPKKLFFPKYTYGVYGKNRKLVVSSGLGNSGIPLRFITPEIVIITLRHSD